MDIKLSEHANLKLKERVSISINDFKKIYIELVSEKNVKEKSD